MPAKRVATDSENLMLLPHPVLPHSEGEIVLDSADPDCPPTIRMNYYDDPHDHEGHGGSDPPGLGYRRALAGQPQDRARS